VEKFIEVYQISNWYKNMGLEINEIFYIFQEAYSSFFVRLGVLFVYFLCTRFAPLCALLVIMKLLSKLFVKKPKFEVHSSF
jgi:hypothetical protein